MSLTGTCDMCQAALTEADLMELIRPESDEVYCVSCQQKIDAKRDELLTVDLPAFIVAEKAKVQPKP